MRHWLPAIAAGVAVALLANPAAAQDPENTLVMELKCGNVHIALRPDVAPNHAQRLKELTREGFYDGVIFHRVIDGFMAQTGDPTGTGMGGSDRPDVAAEFSNVPFNRGTVGMARSSDPNSANSQFFIMFAEGSFLNGQYTVVGEVVEGMDCVDQINKGEPPANPDQIIDMKVMTDAG
jgi:peptidylprolyl isomerase